MLIRLFSSDLFIIILFSVIFLLLIGGILISIYYQPKEYNDSHFSVFINILGSLGLLLLVFDTIIGSVANHINLDIQLRSNYDKAVNSIFLQPFNSLKDDKIRPEFAASFRYSNLNLYNKSKDLKNPETIEIILAEDAVFNSICQSIEDMLFLQKFEQNLDRIWISIMLEYSHSKFFQEKWKVFKLKYDNTSQDFINLLINYSNQIEIPAKEPQAYLEKADLVLENPKFIEILARVTQ
jgi:hypothetical protein